MAADKKHFGGCLCGGIKFEIRVDPLEIEHNCHCTMCQKAIGATNDTVCEVHASNFSLLEKSTEKRYRSSESAYRHFCSKCGCFIFAAVPETEMYYVSAAIIEDFNGNEPKEDIFIGTRKPWVRLSENSIKHESFH